VEVQNVSFVHVKKLFNICFLIVIMLNSYGSAAIQVCFTKSNKYINDMFTNWLLQLGHKQ
jgi:hypothetical protein